MVTTHTNTVALGGQITKFSQDYWTALRIVDDFTIEPRATLFIGTQSTKSHAFVFKDGIHYGCATAARTNADQYAFVDIDGTRLPCLIQYHFNISVGNQSPVTCSVIQRWYAYDAYKVWIKPNKTP